MKSRTLKHLCISLLLALFAPLCIAATATVTQGGADTSLGEAANSVTTLLSHAHGIIEVIFIFCALAMGTSAFLKYRLHRRNPQQVPLSTPVLEAVIAVVLFAIPFIIEYSSSSEAVEAAKPTTSPKHYYIAPQQAGSQAPPPPPPPSSYPH